MSVKSLIKSLTPPILLDAARSLRTQASKTLSSPYRHYAIGRFDAKLNRDHALPRIRARYPLYDRFLPFLAGRLPGRGAIIDVGANVGDTLLLMLNERTPADETLFVCAEPDPDYFALMKENAAQPMAEGYQIILENAFISRSKDDRITVKHAGTATSVKVSTIEREREREFYTLCLTLPELMEKHAIASRLLTLVKVDTDGWDWDCVMSLGDALRTASPLIYWEHWCETPEQHEGYSEMLDYLEEMGFGAFAVFDNVGHLIFTLDADRVKSYHRYLLKALRGEARLNYGDGYY
ncbi:MAG: FkbM family methyltransferase, partial [Synergistaceae bacterium]|nr:FkbM family methyltransferase [Synergistaceae bacterium]